MRPLNSCERHAFWDECVCRHVEYWTIPLGRDWMRAGLSCQLKELNWLSSHFYTTLRPWKSILIECYFSRIWWDKIVWLRYYSAGAYRPPKYVYYGNITGSWRIPGSSCPVLSPNAGIGLEIRKGFTSGKLGVSCYIHYIHKLRLFV